MPTDPITTALILLAALALWALSLLRHPIGACPRCRGARVIHTRTSAKARTCNKCSGHGVHIRRGATTVHRLYWTLISERQRQHRRDKLTRHLDDR
ncbi:hypothetical protein OHR68_03800 [Spirillospora sp. NBC_00431]